MFSKILKNVSILQYWMKDTEKEAFKHYFKDMHTSLDDLLLAGRWQAIIAHI